MRKLIESTLVSLDGVIESPDRWAPFDHEAVELALHELSNYDAFVMGRVTYERLRALWASSVTGNPYTEAINAMPKYVASQTLTELNWNATLLDPDLSTRRSKRNGQHVRRAVDERRVGLGRAAPPFCPFSWAPLSVVEDIDSSLELATFSGGGDTSSRRGCPTGRRSWQEAL